MWIDSKFSHSTANATDNTAQINQAVVAFREIVNRHNETTQKTFDRIHQLLNEIETFLRSVDAADTSLKQAAEPVKQTAAQFSQNLIETSAQMKTLAAANQTTRENLAALTLQLVTFVKNFNGIAKQLEDATFVDGLDVKGLSTTPPEDVRQKALEKFLRGSDNFTNRELRALPFIIYESAVTLDGVKKILLKLNFFKASHLRGLVNVYLTCCDGSEKTELLRQRLQFMPQEMAGNSRRLQKIFATREFLFGDNRLANTAKLFANRQSVDGSLVVLGLSNFFKVSNFIHDALKNFYRTSNLAAQMKILAELDADYNAYQNIFPAVADALIQTVDRANADKKTCMEIFYHRLGDPRFGDDRFKWCGVSDTSREIFCHWLSENDLTIFFKVTRETLNGNTTALNMWNAREEFWHLA